MHLSLVSGIITVFYLKYSAATTATFGGPRQMPDTDNGDDDEEDDFRFNGDPNVAVVQPLVRRQSNLSRLFFLRPILDRFQFQK